jgi:hypothetical protein
MENLEGLSRNIQPMTIKPRDRGITVFPTPKAEEQMGSL